MTTGDIAASASPAPQARVATPRLAESVELIGEFEDSGFKEPPLLARRPDGQVVQLTRLLFLVAEACDGRDLESIAATVTERYGRPVSVDNVTFLVEEKLRPLGVLAQADGSSPELDKRAPLLALRHRRPVLSEAAVNSVARAFAWLHNPLVTTVVLVGVALFDFWLFGIHGIAGGVRSALYSPLLLVGVLASIVLATAFHEFGHASACRRGGARPGVMGVGVYLVWPAFYCDVTDAYRLSRKGRLRTDLGGVYFVTGVEAVLLAAFVQHIIILQQLLPLLRFDGYYVLSDMTGVPDILSRIKPIFRSLVPGRALEPQVTELKPWVRFVVTAYLVALVPALAFVLVWIVMATPRLLATAYDSFGLQLDRIRGAGGADEIVLGGFQMVALTMPLAAMSLSLGRTGRMAGRGLFRWASGSAPRTVVTAIGTVAVLGAAGYIWWPNGDYEPIRPGEKGTIGEAVRSLPKATGGRPFFTPERADEFEAVPTVREERTPLGVNHRRELRERERKGPDGLAPVGEDPDQGETPSDADDDVAPTGDGDGTDSGTDGTSSPAPSATATPAPATSEQTSPEATPTPATTPPPTATATPAPGTTDGSAGAESLETPDATAVAPAVPEVPTVTVAPSSTAAPSVTAMPTLAP